MKLSHIATGVAVSLACAGAALAADQAKTTVTTTKRIRHHHHVQLTESQLIAQQGAQIRQLQAQVAQLNGVDVSTRPNANISRASDAANTGYLAIKNDGQSPFELYPSNSFTQALLENKAAYGATPRSLVLGGYFEGDIQAWNGGNQLPATANSYKNGSNAYLTTAELDTLANINSWLSGFVELKGDFTSSSNPTISKAFVMAGDLNQSPYYAVMGKTNVAFGAFGGGGPWSNALQRTAFRPNETQQLRVGYDHNGLVAEISDLANSNYHSNLQDLTYNVDYSHQVNKVNYTLGVSYLSDIRGLSSAVGDAYNNNMTVSTSQTLFGKQNGVYDVNGQVGYGQYSVIGEFLRSTTGATVIANNQNTGLMSAWMLGGSYSPTLMGKPTAFTLSYSKTNHMATIPMGLAGHAVTAVTSSQGFKNAWIASASREVANNFYVGPDFQLDQAYDNSHTWAATVDLSLYF